MSTSQGHLVWVELMTPQARAATEFYAKVLGWQVRELEGQHAGYTVVSAGEVPVGGLAELPAQARESGWRPAWMGYIAADDVDEMAGRVAQAGGSLVRPPSDIPEVGRFAVAADPQGAVFTIFKPANGEAPPPPRDTPGRVGWRELHAADREAAFGFYEGLFGWTKRDAIDMGPMGVYQIFATADAPAGGMSGGMMRKTDAVPQPTWLYYFNVEAVAAAAARATEAGGRVVNGPHQVPGGSWIVQCLDPQDVTFAMVGPHE